MPEYTRQFSERITEISEAEQRWWRQELACSQKEEQEGLDCVGDWDVTDTSTTLRLHSYQNISDCLIGVLQDFFTRFRPTAFLAIRYAITCSRPEVGEFGGGVVFITADRVVWSDTSPWLQQQVTHFQQTLPHPNMPARVGEDCYAGTIELELTGVAMMRQRRTICLAAPLDRSSVEAITKGTEGNHVWKYQGMLEETIDVTILSRPFSLSQEKDEQNERACG